VRISPAIRRGKAYALISKKGGKSLTDCGDQDLSVWSQHRQEWDKPLGVRWKKKVQKREFQEFVHEQGAQMGIPFSGECYKMAGR